MISVASDGTHPVTLIRIRRLITEYLFLVQCPAANKSTRKQGRPKIVVSRPGGSAMWLAAGIIEIRSSGTISPVRPPAVPGSTWRLGYPRKHTP